MDKNKNRTDLLAAGRKKLQQFRMKKDQKGCSSSHGKSLGKTSKPENDGDPEEPSKLPEPQVAIDAEEYSTDQSDPPVTNEPVDSSSVPVPSADDRRNQEELPTIFLDNQEANNSGSHKCNGKILENRTDDTGSVSDMVPDPGRIIEDLSAVSSSGLEVVQKIDGSSFPSEESGEGAESPSVSNKVESERDAMQISMEDGGIKVGMNEETSASAQADTQSSFLSEQLQEAGANLSDEPGESTSLEENLEVQSSAQDMSSTNGEDDAVAVDSEGERRNSEETAVHLISGHGRTQEEEAGSSILAEDLTVLGTNTSDDAIGATSLEETFAGPSSAHHILAAKEDDGTVQADEEGERKNNEKSILNSWRTQELVGPSILEKELMEDKTNLSYRPGESTYADKTLGTISSSSQVFPGNKGAYGPNRTNYIEENPESIASPSLDISATKGEDVADIADTEEGRRVMEERVLQSSLEEDATVESLEKLPEQGVISVGEMSDRINKEDSQLGRYNSEVESIRQLLYISTIEKDVLQLQLDEQITLDAENQQQSFDEVSKLRDLVKETQDSKVLVNEELKQCRSGLQAMAIAKEELETQCLSTKREMEELRIRENKLQNKLEQSQEGLSDVLVELADCRVSLETLQKENLDLTQCLASEKDARMKLMEKKEFFSSENEKLASEVLAQKEQLIIALNNQVALQSNLRDAGACIEQLAEENLHLASSLDVHERKLRELNERHLELPFEDKESWNQGMALLQMNAEEDRDNSILFGVLKQRLEVAKNILHNLEKSVDSMHSHTVSLSRSGGRGAAPGISKIIQAFELKAHHVEIVSDEMLPPIEGGRLDDSYTLTKEQTYNLRDILKQIESDMGKAEVHLTKEQNSREHPEMFMESETENQQNSFYQMTIDGLVEKVSDYKSKIVDLQNHIDEIQQSANEETTRLSSQVEKLQEEVNHMVAIFKQEEHSNKSVIINAIGKLNACAGLHVDDGLDVGSRVMASIDTAVLAFKSLHEKLEAVHLKYNSLQASFEEMSRSFVDMQGRNVLAFELLRKMYNNLREFVYDSHQNVGDALLDAKTDESLQLLPGKCDLLIGHLHELIDEHHRLLSTNNELEVGLLNRNHEIEELNTRCDVLSKKLEEECRGKEGLESILMNRGKTFEEVSNMVLSLAQKLEDHELSKDFDADSMFMTSDNMESDFCKSMLSRLEALVTFHLQKHDEVTEQINSSRIYLREVYDVTEISAENWSLPLHILLRQEIAPKTSELKEKLQLLSALNIQQETEIQILKEALGKMEETLEAYRSELNSKVSELEQSEQRLSSVREKLSIAIAKGKGLIVQRDSLKQALMEKSSELEKCMQELQSKDTLLQEVEAKLKSCSEVDRVEALESELSYIRNSATALRDSFLLKDSVLQRIEEVLEDLDLPEHFHSKDIVEKIELLSRLAAGNSSFPVADWDQKSSEGRSHSDAGVGGMDAWKDDIQPSSSQEFDELKRKYEELQSKFYGLAEHNDMLEQSLLERNNLAQKWEEMLDRMDMPFHLRTLESEDRIESLGRALSEIQQERDALQLKIENLEVSSDMLIGDLEESHKKISELSAEVVTVKSEKDFFSESLNKLRFQYLAVSEKAVHDEVERENLQRELADLQQKFVEQVEMKGRHDFENEMRKLHDMIVDALTEGDNLEPISDENESASLETLARKLIDNYTLLSDKSKNVIADVEDHSVESNLSLDKQSFGDVLHDKDQQLLGPVLELDEASQNMSLVKEGDAAMEKCHSLTLEIDEINRHMKLLQAERIHDMEVYQSLVLELEAAGKQRDALQEQLSQEEKKTAAAREKLNVAVRKGKGLVQQRDSLKQTIEEMNTMVEHLKAEHNQRVEALESEKSLLMNHLAESKHDLQEYSQNLSRLLTIVHSIDVGSEVNIIDPIQKMEEIGKISRDLHSAVVSSEHEAKKSKQAAELLLVELNEVQDRVDILQEDLEKAEAALAECYKLKNDAEAAKAEALSHLEQFMSVHSEERKKQIDNLAELKSGIDQLRKGCIAFSSLLSDVFRNDADLFSCVQSFLESILQQMEGENVADLPVLGSNDLFHINQISVDNSNVGDVLQVKKNLHIDDGLIAEHLAVACRSLHECTTEYDDLKEKVHQYPFSLHQHITCLLETLGSVKRKLDSQREYSESLKEDVTRLELVIKEKETEICSMHRNMSFLYEACRSCIAEIESRKAQTVRSNFTSEGHAFGISSGVVTLSSYVDAREHTGAYVIHADHSIRRMADSLLSAIRSSTNINETTEGNQKELKATISDLQRELQEKDIEMKRISEQLVSQIRDAEAITRRSLTDLDSARAHIFSLEEAAAEMENDKQLPDERISELKDCEASLQELQDRFKILTGSLAAKDQEIEGLKSGLMQALDEEESKTEALENRNKELEDIVQEKILALGNLEASREKALAKLSTTVSKFDELYNLSESLLAEVESLQSQLHERDSEISFLRQEVTRCTNNDLASQETNKKYLSEINEVLTRMEMMVSRFGESHRHANDQNGSQIQIYTDILDKRIVSVMNELEDLRVTAQSKDALLQIERGRVEELLKKIEDLAIIPDKEIQREPSQGERDSGQPSSLNSQGHVEIEQMVQRNKVSIAPIVTHIRSGRKVNNDQIAIAIDMKKDDNLLEDEDDDKSHGFKSLTMSRLVPRATRSVSDRIDGIWVSAERLLMRQPSLRLGVIVYWILLHALLASII